jgi:hypothetical protein
MEKSWENPVGTEIAFGADVHRPQQLHNRESVALSMLSVVALVW